MVSAHITAIGTALPPVVEQSTLWDEHFSKLLTGSTDPAAADHMTWTVTDHGFRMTLSPQVPDVLGKHVRHAVDALLAGHGLTVPDVRGWAVHPGGPRIIDTVEHELGLAADALEPSRHVLREHGNCSSATVVMVLDELLRTTALRPGDPVVAMAFGLGLTLYITLLRAR